jgi:hypothetical protein
MTACSLNVLTDSQPGLQSSGYTLSEKPFENALSPYDSTLEAKPAALVAYCQYKGTYVKKTRSFIAIGEVM